jgi:nucleotide-binding universal stress UspA family protein
METFGSDEAEPRISSVRRVRECDVFVGIYARRYGTVDPESGKSITELELEEAERAHSAGNVRAILLYVLKDQAPWPAQYVDADPASEDKLGDGNLCGQCLDWWTSVAGTRYEAEGILDRLELGLRSQRVRFDFRELIAAARREIGRIESAWREVKNPDVLVMGSIRIGSRH